VNKLSLGYFRIIGTELLSWAFPEAHTSYDEVATGKGY